MTNASSLFRTLGQTLGIGLLVAGLLVSGAGCDSGGDGGDGDGPAAPAAPILNGEPAQGTAELTWQAGDADAEFNIYRSTSPTDSVSGEPLASTSETSYTDQDVENGTTYYYRITAVVSDNVESDPSSEVEVTPFAAPSSLEGESGNEQIGLSWSAGTGAEEYHVYRSQSSTEGVSDPPVAIVSDTTGYTDGSVKNGETYYYRVTSAREGVESSPTDEVAKRPFEDPPDNP